MLAQKKRDNDTERQVEKNENIITLMIIILLRMIRNIATDGKKNHGSFYYYLLLGHSNYPDDHAHILQYELVITCVPVFKIGKRGHRCEKIARIRPLALS